MSQSALSRLNEPVTSRMHQEFTRLQLGQNVAEALRWLREHPPSKRIIYFYIVDESGRLEGVVPARSLILSPAETPLADIMIRKPIALPARATVLEACEFFIHHRLLAFPVVDEERRVLGVVDVDLYAQELSQLDQATPAGRLAAPFLRFVQIESASGLLLLLCTLAALILANSPLAGAVQSFWQKRLGFTLGAWTLEKSLLFWINDGLMSLFFFVVGLEIKHEFVCGELSDRRKALLPIVAALGGMILPALIYLLCLRGRPGTHGWGVPMATDIAFVVGFLTIFGKRVPSGLKMLMLTLAIADDLGAVIVIAAAYSSNVGWEALLLAGAGAGLTLLLRFIGVRTLAAYIVVGAVIWLAFLKSGVHPTIAGALLGFLTPATPLVTRRILVDVVGDLYGRLRFARDGIARQTHETQSPAERLQSALHPWVAFGIMPLFALANADVRFDGAALASPVALAVIAGLALGKPFGIVLFSWASVRLGLTRLPDGLNWRVIMGAGCLGGIGFTMSIFIASLAFEPPLLDQGKIGILAGSTVSALLGCLILWLFLPSKDQSRTASQSQMAVDELAVS